MKQDSDSDFDPNDNAAPGTHPLVLLVVFLALAAIVANIVVPNVAQYGKGPMTKAIGEIQSTEMALTKLLADAQQTRPAGLFDVPALQEAQRATAAERGLSGMQAANEVYGTVFYALLHHGRNAPTFLAQDPTTRPLAEALDTATLQKLGPSYLDIADDPWGQPYQIYPGPWPAARGPNPFRTYLQLVNSGDSYRGPAPDALTLAIPGEYGLETVGYPADRNRIAFIWSYGENKKNDQPHYGNDATTPTTPKLRYRDDAAPEELGGGDDVNNWDNTRSFERFYN